jgi:hypothetical protein
MWGHRNAASRYDYLRNIGPKEGVPTDGTASNEICIFPPSIVYAGIEPPIAPWASGLVFVDKLRFGTHDSDSVRRLQDRLNHISLKNGKDLRITGNYDIDTKNEVTKWQIQLDGCAPGSPGADGNIGPKQARKLFTAPFVVREHS